MFFYNFSIYFFFLLFSHFCRRCPAPELGGWERVEILRRGLLAVGALGGVPSPVPPAGEQGGCAACVSVSLCACVPGVCPPSARSPRDRSLGCASLVVFPGAAVTVPAPSRHWDNLVPGPEGRPGSPVPAELPFQRKRTEVAPPPSLSLSGGAIFRQVYLLRNLKNSLLQLDPCVMRSGLERPGLQSY